MRLRDVILLLVAAVTVFDVVVFAWFWWIDRQVQRTRESNVIYLERVFARRRDAE